MLLPLLVTPAEHGTSFLAGGEGGAVMLHVPLQLFRVGTRFWSRGSCLNTLVCVPASCLADMAPFVVRGFVISAPSCSVCLRRNFAILGCTHGQRGAASRSFAMVPISAGWRSCTAATTTKTRRGTTMMARGRRRQRRRRQRQGRRQPAVPWSQDAVLELWLRLERARLRSYFFCYMGLIEIPHRKTVL